MYSVVHTLLEILLTLSFYRSRIVLSIFEIDKVYVSHSTSVVYLADLCRKGNENSWEGVNFQGN